MVDSTVARLNAHEILPDLYGAIAQQVLGALPLKETRSTCSNCAMCNHSDAVSPYRLFESSVKCCSYLPQIPNFLVGAVLKDENTLGAQTMRERLGTGIAVAPLGVGMAPSYKMVYEALSRGNGFGRTEILRCPHLTDVGECAIWKHRNGVCSTWFCKTNRGSLSNAFWQSMELFLRVFERDLSIWCAQEMGVNFDCIIRALSEFSERPDIRLPREILAPEGAKAYGEMWGDFEGREEEFYVGCAELVRTATPDELLSVGGPELTLRRAKVVSAFQALSYDSRPARVRIQPMRKNRLSDGVEYIETHSPYDPLRITNSIRRVLELVPTAGADVETILQSQGVSDSDFQTLLDYGVLVPQRDQ